MLFSLCLLLLLSVANAQLSLPPGDAVPSRGCRTSPLRFTTSRNAAGEPRNVTAPDGMVREMLIAAPAEVVALGGPRPLIFQLHGAGARTVGSQEARSKLAERALELGGPIVATLGGLPDPNDDDKRRFVFFFFFL